MPLIARGIGSGDLVTCDSHGTGDASVPCGCCGTLITTTDICSPNVFVARTGAVRLKDTMTAHPRNYGTPTTLCNTHLPPCNAGSPNVFVNTEPVARMDDTYYLRNNHIITTVTQGTVFANG